MYRRKAVLIIALLSAMSSAALACVVFLPEQVLSERDVKLKAPIANTFAFETAKLAPVPKDDFKPVEDWVHGWPQAAGQKNGQSADEKSPAHVEYLAGAADYNSGDFEKAAGHFLAVIDLPDQERRSRATSAAYMLGRLAASAGDADKMAKSYALVREFARGGAADPDGLAVASFGEEALFHLRRAKSLPVAADYAREIGLAISLYAEQAARGSEGGVASLSIVAQLLIKTPGAAAAAIEDPAGRRLLAVYTLAKLDSGDPSQKDWGWAWDHRQPPDAVLPDDVLSLLAAGVEKHPADWLVDGDRLAALAYRLGRYDLAKTYAEKTDGPLAAWVKAKLALQAGDLTAAASFYAAAAKAFQPAAQQSPLDDWNRARLAAETGAVALARGDYVEALRLLDGPGDDYYLDAAYIAERVLTVDELKSYVDGKAKGRQPVRDRISDILARRMMREGRGGDAVSYYKDDATRQQAANYVRLLAAADHGWSKAGRAEALFGAATIARKSGLEIMGSEQEPDEVWLQGNFLDMLQGGEAPAGQFVTEDEQKRFAASEVRPLKRWHYRYVAADEAAKAADLLPPRSQAFAAVLACATSWTIETDPGRAREFYARYVREGAIVPFGFGADSCPDPNFEKARFMAERAWVHRTGHALARPRRIGAAILAIAAILAAAVIFRRKLKSRR